MPIVVQCGCGAVLRAPDKLAGQKAACPTCMAIMQLPSQPTAASRMPRRAGSGRFMYLLLLLALIPMGWVLFYVNVPAAQAEEELHKRINQAVESDPHAKEQARNIAVEQRTPDNMLVLLPGRRLQGAWLPRDTRMHWAVAGAAAAVFFLVILIGFPRQDASVRRLAVVGLFTATIGIALLLGLQILAVWSLTHPTILWGGNIFAVVVYLLRFIGLAYYAAMDPASTGSVSLLGFTMGVGMCEELCKALPLLVHYHRRSEFHLSWNAACAVGLISGAAFGVAEGIMYAHTYYNGVEARDAYVVRFISCVALHAMWTGAAAISIQRRQDVLQKADTIAGVVSSAIGLVFIPMVLHGAFNTLLKKDFNIAAVGVALVSVVWLAYQIEMARRDQGDTLVFAR